MSEQNGPTSQFGSALYGYSCPITHSPLQLSANGQLKAVGDGRSYRIEDGIPNFLSSSPVESEEEIRKLQVLLEAGQNRGCERALRECDSEAANYVLDESRAKYLDLLPLGSESHVLEVGASKGQHTRLIAKRCRFVQAIDVVGGQIQFAREWCTQLGCTNVGFAVGGDDSRLPYFDGTFDAVILNYVLEWSASRSEKKPIDGQRLLLAECNRVLKPGGFLFLSTKNRFSPRLFLGATDEHVNFRFGNALPRWLMQLVLRIKGRSRPNGLLHSYHSLKGMLSQSGFKELTSYWAIPDARFPLAYVQFTPEAITAARQDSLFHNAGPINRFMLKFAPIKLIKTLATSHVFIAYKSVS